MGDDANRRLTLEIALPGGWQTLGEVTLLEGEARGLNSRTEFAYDIDYAARYAERSHYFGASVSAPVTMVPTKHETWPSFLLDLFPQGAALQFVVDHYRIADRPENYWKILSTARLNPPGNLRCVTQGTDQRLAKYASSHKGFSKSEVVAKGAQFLEYMIEMGAPVAGATGAGGAAPKFLLREDQKGRFHADGVLDDAQTKNCWLVKFPRGRQAQDSAILHAEKHYLDIAKELGLNVFSESFYEKETLFVPRFDRRREGSRYIALGMESFYSMIGRAEFGSRLRHESYLKALAKYSSQPEQDVAEYILRDLLNLMLGNTDNHGRNQSLLKGPDWTVLAPVYDLAPMKFDVEGIVRNTRWEGGVEDGELEDLVPFLEEELNVGVEVFVERLRVFCKRAEKLEKRLIASKISPQFIAGTEGDRKRTMSSMTKFLKERS